MFYSPRPNTDYISNSYVPRIHQWEHREKNKIKQNKKEILIEEGKIQKPVCPSKKVYRPQTSYKESLKILIRHFRGEVVLLIFILSNHNLYLHS